MVQAALEGVARGLWLELKEEVPCHLKAEPARCHTRGHLEQIGDNTLVKTPDAFLGDDDSEGIGNGLVLVAHA